MITIGLQSLKNNCLYYNNIFSSLQFPFLAKQSLVNERKWPDISHLSSLGSIAVYHF